jgi:hypothetical protein
MAQSSLPPQNPPYEDREVIVVNKDGIWLADGSEITHEPTRRLFARSLKKDSEGYFLSIGRETKRIVVEDTAYFVERIVKNADSKIENADVSLHLSDGTQETLDPGTLRYSPGRLTCRIKNGSDEAKFLRGPYYEILRDLESDQGTAKTYFLNFNDKKIRL